MKAPEHVRRCYQHKHQGIRGHNLEPLYSAGARIENGAVVAEHGRTNLPGVWAMGNLANRPTPFAPDGRARLKSVPSALEQSRSVAADILGLRSR